MVRTIPPLHFGEGGEEFFRCEAQLRQPIHNGYGAHQEKRIESSIGLGVFSKVVENGLPTAPLHFYRINTFGIKRFCHLRFIAFS